MSGLSLAAPAASSLARARRRVGAAPLRALFETIAGPVAQRGHGGSFYRGLRSRSTAGLDPEVWALLTAYQALIRVAGNAAATRPGLPMERISFTALLDAAFADHLSANSSESSGSRSRWMSASA